MEVELGKELQTKPAETSGISHHFLLSMPFFSCSEIKWKLQQLFQHRETANVSVPTVMQGLSIMLGRQFLEMVLSWWMWVSQAALFSNNPEWNIIPVEAHPPALFSSSSWRKGSWVAQSEISSTIEANLPTLIQNCLVAFCCIESKLIGAGILLFAVKLAEGNMPCNENKKQKQLSVLQLLNSLVNTSQTMVGANWLIMLNEHKEQ